MPSDKLSTSEKTTLVENEKNLTDVKVILKGLFKHYLFNSFVTEVSVV